MIELVVPADFSMPDAVPAGRILVTGAAGQLGMDVMRVAAAAGCDAIGVDRAELDITDAPRVRQFVEELRPSVIIHCAAWTAVDDAESHEDAARQVNEAGTANIADAARAVGAKLVAVSTDYVFPGDATDGYAEGDATGPANAYGRTKLRAEAAALSAPGAVVARTAWLFGEHGANFVRTIAGLAQTRDSLDVVNDQTGSPTWSLHLARALITCAASDITGIVHLAGAPTATWYDVACEVVRQLGATCEVRPVSSDAFPRPAARPACSILRVTRAGTPAMGDWRDGVAAVISALQPATR